LRRLFMKVEDVMSVSPVSIDRDEFVTKARDVMREYNFQSLPVMSKGKLDGIVTASDIIRVTSSRSNVTVGGYVREVRSVTPEMSLTEAAEVIMKTPEGRVPVMKGGHIVGILSIADIFDGIDELGPSEGPVENVMTRKVITCSPDENVSKAWMNMLEFDITGMPVVRENGEVIGMVTREDIIKRGYARIARESDRGDMHSTTVQKIMSTPPVTVNVGDTVKTVARIFSERNIGRVPVLNNKKLAGIVDRYDVLGACRRTMLVEPGKR
jgi:CBS domain-containing protein